MNEYEKKMAKSIEQSLNARISIDKMTGALPQERVWGVPKEVWSDRLKKWIPNVPRW